MCAKVKEADKRPISPEKESGVSNAQGDSVLAVPTFLKIPFIINGILFIIFFFLLGMLLIKSGFARPITPARGDWAFRIDLVILCISVGLFQWLLFFAIQKGFGANWLAKELKQYVRWPKNTVETLWRSAGFQKDLEQKDIDDEAFSRWLNVRFIAAVTDPVQRIIFYPFVVLALFIIARTSIFDRFHIPPFLLAIFSLSIGLVVIAAVSLRFNSEKVRKRAVQTLNEHITAAMIINKQELAKGLTAMRDEVVELKTGAFAPFAQQPLVKALLTVVGSISGVTLLEYANLANF